jgi:hypothetical protein
MAATNTLAYYDTAFIKATKICIFKAGKPYKGEGSVQLTSLY